MTVFDEPTQVLSTKSTRGATGMEAKNFTWPVIILVLGLVGMVVTGIVLLSIFDKPTEAILTAIVTLLVGLGLFTHTTTQKGISDVQQTADAVKEQTNGRMTAMQRQQESLIEMVKDLALRIPNSQQSQEGQHGHGQGQRGHSHGLDA